MQLSLQDGEGAGMQPKTSVKLRVWAVSPSHASSHLVVRDLLLRLMTPWSTAVTILVRRFGRTRYGFSRSSKMLPLG
jgi:hypothetical protein